MDRKVWTGRCLWVFCVLEGGSTLHAVERLIETREVETCLLWRVRCPLWHSTGFEVLSRWEAKGVGSKAVAGQLPT